MESGPLLINFDVTAELVWDIARWRAYFIMSPYYQYKVIELDEHGFYTRRADDGDRDVEP